MVNKIKSKLSFKIFLGFSAISITLSLLLFFVLQTYIPKTYENEENLKLIDNLQSLSEELSVCNQDEWADKLFLFSINNQVKANISNLDNEIITNSGFYDYKEGEEFLGDDISYVSTFDNNNQKYIIAIQTNNKTTSELSNLFIKIFPYITCLIVLFSFLLAYFYTRFITKPIINISQTAKQLSSLELDSRCDVQRTDEIGVLAHCLNEMASKLDSTMNDLMIANNKLQKDIENEKEKEALQKDFFAAISHELKTPITILKGQLDGMICNVGKFKNRDMYLLEAYNTTETIEKLTKEMLDLAKMDSVNLNKEPVNINLLVQDYCKRQASYIATKNMLLTLNLDAPLIVEADFIHIKKVISNIIGNAFYHSPIEANVIITTYPDRLVVKNSGVYLDEKYINQLFEPFYRTDKSRSRYTGGNGLGLYIVKRILTSHGYSYKIENYKDGVSFTIFFS